jgi:hypothetical protein
VSQDAFDLHSNQRRKLSDRGVYRTERVTALTIERAGRMQFAIADQACIGESVTNSLSKGAAYA